jgi:hypothetical protein
LGCTTHDEIISNAVTRLEEEGYKPHVTLLKVAINPSEINWSFKPQYKIRNGSNMTENGSAFPVEDATEEEKLEWAMTLPVIGYG